MDDELRKALQEADEDEAQSSVATVPMTGSDGGLVDIEEELGLPRSEGEDDASYSHRLVKSLEAAVIDESGAVYETGKRLVILADERLFQEETFNKFVASHKTSGWGRSKIAEVMSQVRDFLLGSVVKVEERRLAQIGWRKMQEIHGVIKDGIIDVETALADAEVLSVQDLVKNKKDWRMAYAKQMGLAPTSVNSCLSCMELREWEPGKDNNALYLGEGVGETEITDAVEGTVSKAMVMSQDTRQLRVKKLVYCNATGNVLYVNGKMSRTSAEARAETCPYFKEQF